MKIGASERAFPGGAETPPEGRTFEATVRVRSYELDRFGHVNHAVYLGYLEQARYDALAEGGLPHDEIHGRGWAIYVVRVEVEYLKECTQGDVLRVRTRVESFGKASVVIRQEIMRDRDGPDGAPALRARVTLVWISERGRPMRVPAEARRALGGTG